jgi:uncharacterized protein (TIGR03437 family)
VPLAVAFGADGKALLATKLDLSLLDPETGIVELLDTMQSLASKTLPQPGGSAPPDVTETALGVSGDRQRIYGSTEAFGLIYDVASKTVNSFPTKGGFPFGPRAVSVSKDGSYFAFGWSVWDRDGRFRNDFPNVTGQFSVGSHAIDSESNVMYSQIPEEVQIGPPGPVLRVMDADNLTVREWLNLPENLAGKSIFSSDRRIIYTVSDSGVVILPVGALNQISRIRSNREILTFGTAFCNARSLTQEVVISDPGGNATDFTLKSTVPGVTIAPLTGVTPATIRISVDPAAFRDLKGTLAGEIQVTSSSAVNVPDPIRITVNGREPDQRGTIVPLAGKLVDLLPDPVRDRFYILRQDKNEVLVFDGTTLRQITTLRTNSNPSQMAVTRDGKYLLVGHLNAWDASVFDLERLAADTPIRFPYAHYPLSIAVSGSAILALTDNREVGRGYNTIDRVDLTNRTAGEIPTLGAYENKFNTFVALTGNPNGGSIFGAATDGSTILYNASADTFTVFRKDFTSLQGAFAASNNEQYFAGQSLLNASLVVSRRLPDTGSTAGFSFLDDYALRVTASAASGPGVLERVNLRDGTTSESIRLVEAPIMPGSGNLYAIPRLQNPFTRAMAFTPARNSIVVLSQSGFTALPFTYTATQTAAPFISAIVNAADGQPRIALGSVITIYGNNMNPVSVANRDLPWPTVLGDTCVTVADRLIPLNFVSPAQLNAQLPFDLTTSPVPVVVRSPNGVSAAFSLPLSVTAPAIFRTNVPDLGLVPMVYRKTNNTLVTLSNPVRKGDELSIYVTGLGPTTPGVDAGFPGPSDPKAIPNFPPAVLLDGNPMSVSAVEYEAGQVGVYRIDFSVPFGVRQGLQIPLAVAYSSTNYTEVAVRVIEGN